MPRRLPVIQPTDEPRFATLREREGDLMLDVDHLTLDELRRFPLLSGNAKTSLSLDFPIGQGLDHAYPVVTQERVSEADHR